MNNKKHVLAFALSVATTISATIPHEDVAVPVSPLIAAAQSAETNETLDTERPVLVAAVINGLQQAAEKTEDDNAPLSDVQQIEAAMIEVALPVTPASETTSCPTPEATCISIEEAQALLGNNEVHLVDGFTFEHEGKLYMIKIVVAQNTPENPILEESNK